MISGLKWTVSWPANLICAAAVTLIALLSSLAHADDPPTQMEAWAERFEIRAGILAHDSGFLGDAGPRNEAYAVNAEILFPSPDVLSFAFNPRPKIGVSLAPHADGISFVYAGLNWDVPVYGNWFVHAGVGGSLNNADNQGNSGSLSNEQRALGCRALFHLSAGFGYRVTEDVSVQVYGDHISNATLCDMNEGLDQWGVRLGKAF
jgi:lipid A 3-O-deacylase